MPIYPNLICYKPGSQSFSNKQDVFHLKTAEDSNQEKQTKQKAYAFNQYVKSVFMLGSYILKIRANKTEHAL